MKTLSMSKLPFSLMAFILLTLISCQKEELQKELTNQELWNCHTAEALSEAALKQRLIGTWNWKNKACPFNPNDVPTDTEHAGLSAEFKSDNSLTIKQDEEIVFQTTWSLIESETAVHVPPIPSYQLRTDLFVDQFLGVIVLCEDELLFMSSYIDGCDNRFEKED